MSRPPAELRKRLTPVKQPLTKETSDDERGLKKAVPPSPPKYDAVDLVLLVVTSACLRFWRIDDPDSVVFDEYHFGKFVNWYFQGKYLFDIHPPLGKLVLSFVGLLFGYDPSVCRYDEIHQVYQPACKYLVLRYTSAVFGILLPPVMYLILRQMGVSRFAAVLGGCIINLDMLNLMESRLILTDSQLMLYSALSLYVALLFWERLNACLVTPTSGNKHSRPSNGTFKMSKREENAWCIGLGLICGAALSVKWTALATPALIGLESFAGFFVLQKPMPFRMMGKVLAVAFVEYAVYFWIHFALLPYSGDGDAFMPIEFQRTLVNNTAYDPNAPKVWFFEIFPELNREMLSANARIDVVHHWASRFHQWIINGRGVLYWSKDDVTPGMSRIVYLMGNPIVLWAVLLGVIGFALIRVVALAQRGSAVINFAGVAVQASAISRFLSLGTYCFVCYWLNLLPYIAVSRSAFCYHYMPGLFYGEVLLVLVLDAISEVVLKPYRVAVLGGVLLAFTVGLWYWSPWVYALPLTPAEHASRRWFSTWD